MRTLTSALVVLMAMTAPTVAHAQADQGSASQSAVSDATEEAAGRYPTVFRDTHGEPVTLKTFLAGADQHQRFTMKVDKQRHETVMTLLPLGVNQPRSQPTSVLLPMLRISSGQTLTTLIPKPGSTFPTFSLAKLGGGTISAAQLKGHPYVVDFFFADCVGCIAELPQLNAFHHQHPRWPLVAITFDDAKTAAQFVRQRHFNWPIAYSGMAFDHKVGVQVYPTMVVVGADGKVLATRVGTQTGATAASLQKWVASSVAHAHKTAIKG